MENKIKNPIKWFNEFEPRGKIAIVTIALLLITVTGLSAKVLTDASKENAKQANLQAVETKDAEEVFILQYKTQINNQIVLYNDGIGKANDEIDNKNEGTDEVQDAIVDHIANASKNLHDNLIKIREAYEFICF